MDTLYTTICVDCSNDLREAGIPRVNMIVKAFMKAVLQTPKLRDSTEYRFSRCSNNLINDFLPADQLTSSSGTVHVQINTDMVYVDTSTEKKLHYPVFANGDSARHLCETVAAAHDALVQKIKDVRKSGTAVYTGLLLVVADGVKCHPTPTRNEKELIDNLMQHSSGAKANGCHIVPILIDLHSPSETTTLKRLSAGFPDGYVQIGTRCPEAAAFQNCFADILHVVNKSITNASRRQQVLDEVSRRLKELKRP